MILKVLEIFLLIMGGCMFFIPLTMNVIDFVKWWNSKRDIIIIQSPDGDEAELSPFNYSPEELSRFLEVWSKLK